MKSLNLSKPNILNLLVCIFPLTFILGTLFVNIIILLISILGILFYREKLFNIEKNNLLVFLSFFFLLLIVSTYFENIGSDNNHFLKSFLYLRYFIFLLVIRYIILKGDLNFSQFFLTCLILSSLVAADVIFQYFIGVNILGFEATPHNRPGLFRTEAVAGGYIQKFLVLGVFGIPMFLNKNKSKIIFYLALVLIVGFLGIIFSGNRMPVILFIFFILLSSLVLGFKKFKLTKLFFLIFIFSLFTFLINKSERLNTSYLGFYAGLTELSEVLPEIGRDYPELEEYKNSGKPFHETEGRRFIENYKMLPNYTGHTSLYITSIQLFIESPIIGRGIKSFRNTCKEVWHLPNRTCQLHPHHIYLEILNYTGALGFLIIFITLLVLFIKNINKYHLKNLGNKKNLNLIFYAVAFALLIEFFPFRSHGSFFSTNTSSYIFLLIGMFFGLYDLQVKNFSKK